MSGAKQIFRLPEVVNHKHSRGIFFVSIFSYPIKVAVDPEYTGRSLTLCYVRMTRWFVCMWDGHFCIAEGGHDFHIQHRK